VDLRYGGSAAAGRGAQSAPDSAGAWLLEEAFAGFLKVHRTYLGAVERGERNLTLQTVERLAGDLGVDTLSLLGGK
jgi:transcriptional regulator with XRE-family HTH domain